MFSFFKRIAPLPDAPVPTPASAPQSVAEPADTNNVRSIRETIDLLEFDLSAMIREVERAAASFHGGASAAMEALVAIRASSETLDAKSQDAKRDANHVADATFELARSSSEIGAMSALQLEP